MGKDRKTLTLAQSKGRLDYRHVELDGLTNDEGQRRVKDE
jgi:hypothetical protein